MGLQGVEAAGAAQAEAASSAAAAAVEGTVFRSVDLMVKDLEVVVETRDH